MHASWEILQSRRTWQTKGESWESPGQVHELRHESGRFACNQDWRWAPAASILVDACQRSLTSPHQDVDAFDCSKVRRSWMSLTDKRLCISSDTYITQDSAAGHRSVGCSPGGDHVQQALGAQPWPGGKHELPPVQAVWPQGVHIWPGGRGSHCKRTGLGCFGSGQLSIRLASPCKLMRFDTIQHQTDQKL